MKVDESYQYDYLDKSIYCVFDKQRNALVVKGDDASDIGRINFMISPGDVFSFKVIEENGRKSCTLSVERPFGIARIRLNYKLHFVGDLITDPVAAGEVCQIILETPDEAVIRVGPGLVRTGVSAPCEEARVVFRLGTITLYAPLDIYEDLYETIVDQRLVLLISAPEESAVLAGIDRPHGLVFWEKYPLTMATSDLCSSAAPKMDLTAQNMDGASGLSIELSNLEEIIFVPAIDTMRLEARLLEVRTGKYDGEKAKCN
jgi:hypothetical protein